MTFIYDASFLKLNIAGRPSAFKIIEKVVTVRFVIPSHDKTSFFSSAPDSESPKRYRNGSFREQVLTCSVFYAAKPTSCRIPRRSEPLPLCALLLMIRLPRPTRE